MLSRLHRQDVHNVTVDDALASAGRCGMTHLRTGRRCTLPARHAGGCRFTPVPAAATATDPGDSVTATGPPARESLVDLVARLVSELAGVVPAGAVIEAVLHQRDALRRAGVPDERLVAAIEQAVRTALGPLVRSKR